MNIKYKLPSLLLALLLGGAATAIAQTNLTSEPGYLPIDKVLDVKIAHPEVNINLPRFLLRDAASEFNGGPDDPLAATGINFSNLIKDIKLIRVMVIEANDKNKAHIQEGVKKLRKELETKWTPVVSVSEDNVGIYAASDASGDTMAGLAVLVQDDEDVVIANLVGKVSIGKVVKLATQVNAIPPEVLEKLSGMSSNGEKSNGEKTPTSKEAAKEDKTEETKP